MKIFFSVGEPSGDLHGANLIRALRSGRSDVTCVGFGGPKMAEAGCDLHADLTAYAVMWITQVFKHVYRFRQLYVQARRYFQQQPPDAVVLIDYPGFNWWVARAAKSCGIPVFYFGTPQMWAWGAWRVHKMRRLVDHALCKLPFEADWFNARQCRATYVGHPYFDELETRELDHSFLEQIQSSDAPLLTILPGSRTQEVAHNFPWFLKAARLVQREAPQTRVAVASFNERQAAQARRLAEQAEMPIDIFAGRTPELIHAANCCLACSGSVSLELLYHQKPTAILYWMPRLKFMMMRHLLIQVQYITLVNLLAADDPFECKQQFDPYAPGAELVPFPEYPTYEDKSFQLAQHALQWLTDPIARQRKVAQLASLKERFAQSGASANAARYILDTLSSQAASKRAAA